MRYLLLSALLFTMLSMPVSAGNNETNNASEDVPDIEMLWRTGPEYVLTDEGIVPAVEYDGEPVKIIFLSEDLRTCGAPLEWAFNSENITDQFGQIEQFFVQKPLSLLDLNKSALYPCWPDWTIYPYDGPYNPGDIFYAEAVYFTDFAGDSGDSGYTTEYEARRTGSL